MADWYVSPSGSSTNAGTFASPWSLPHAFSGSGSAAAISAGDTVWFRGGTYQYNGNDIKCYLQGSAGNHITMRSAQGEWAIINTWASDHDQNTTGYLYPTKAYVTWRDLEIYHSDTTVRSADTKRGGLYFNLGTPHHNNVINCILHDMRSGIGTQMENQGGEIYGCIIFNHGWNGSSQEHAIYLQNDGVARKTVKDCILFNCFGYGLHGYGASVASMKDCWIEGNICFNAGAAYGVGYATNSNILMAGNYLGINVDNIVIKNNYTYQTPATVGGWPNGSVYLGYIGNQGQTNQTLTLTDNVFNGNLIFYQDWVSLTCSGNTVNRGVLIEGIPGDGPASGVIYVASPSTNAIYVRPNAYETGRAHVAVYNWQNLNSVSVDLSSIGLNVNDTYAVWHVYDLTTPVVTGTYTGANVVFPMADKLPPYPIGWTANTRVTLSKEFGAFLVKKTGVAAGTTYYCDAAATGINHVGSAGDPFSFQQVGENPNGAYKILPGDTILFKAGTYKQPTAADFSLATAGTVDNYVTYRAETPTTRVKFDPSVTTPNNSGHNILLAGNYTRFIDIEFCCQTNTTRTSANEGSFPNDIYLRGECKPTGNFVEFVNCQFHDLQNGMSSQKDATGGGYYGCLSWGNGWYSTFGGGQNHGHGAYLQNTGGQIKTIYDCVSWDNYSLGLQCYSSADKIDDITLDGFTTMFSGDGTGGGSVFIGGPSEGTRAPSRIIIDNSHDWGYFDYPSGAKWDIGDYGKGYENGNLKMRNNYFVASIRFQQEWASVAGDFSGNTVYGKDYDGNRDPPTWTPAITNWASVAETLPTGSVVYCRENPKRAKWATVVIYNWDEAANVDIPAAKLTFLDTNDTYTLVSVGDYWGTPVASGTYTAGTNITVPMQARALPAILGTNTHKTAGTMPVKFGAFVLKGNLGGGGGTTQTIMTGQAVETESVHPATFPPPYTVATVGKAER